MAKLAKAIHTLFAALAQAATANAQPAPPPASSRADADIYYAAVFNNRAAVERHLANDPRSVNARDKWGFTPLHGVVGEHHVDMARLLIARGADVNAANDEGITPLHLAAWPEMVRLLLAADARLEARDIRGNTPLHIAAEHPERLDVMEALLRAGADTAAANKKGLTPLAVATELREIEMMDLLRSHAAK